MAKENTNYMINKLINICKLSVLISAVCLHTHNLMIRYKLRYLCQVKC
jgi:hypothetical protein